VDAPTRRWASQSSKQRDITMYGTIPAYDGVLSEQRLRRFVQDAVDSLN